ncbi:MAG: alpha-amylase [Gammaproteobacteria bacterium]|nr:alpha-amylase [Gammaproteobacteria bacterium]
MRQFVRVVLVLLCLLPAARADLNGVIMQYFHWDLPTDQTLWSELQNGSQDLADAGFTALWLPPAYKGASGGYDVGYGVYDLYDLGEFNQQGTVPTKYGTRAQYEAAIQSAQTAGLEVYADIVLNHRMGAESTESAWAVRVDENNRNIEYWADVEIDAWTYFDFPGRNGTHSSFQWRWYHFDGVDWAENLGGDGCGGCRIYKFRGTGKAWDDQVDTEKGNFDYLMGADVDLQHPDVINELKSWGEWYVSQTNIDGFRLDAVKHMKYGFINEWLYHQRATSGKPLFAVGEYYSYDVNKITAYLDASNGGNDSQSAFDMPLYAKFRDASNAGGRFNMATLFDNTLIQARPAQAVTYVESHDTQPGQSFAAPTMDWFKPLAYATILLRQDGYPSVFYADYYGATYGSTVMPSHKAILDILLAARRDHAHGVQHDYFDHDNIVGWTREGDSEHWKGLAALISDGPGGSKWMYAGWAHRNACFRDITGNEAGCVWTNNDGWGEFRVGGGSLSVWVKD